MTSTRRTSLLLAPLFAAALAVAPPAVAGDGPGGGHGHSGGHGGSGPSVLALPNGFQPEGIAIDRRGTAYLGSRADGDIYALDLRTGAGEVVSQGPGTPSLGMKVDDRGLLWVAGGTGGDARVVDPRSGRTVASWQLVPAGTPAFVNDVVLTDDGAWFTDSASASLFRVETKRHGHDHGHDHGHGHRRHGHDGVRAKVTQVPLSGAWVQTADATNANGIATTPDERALLVVNSADGRLYRVDRSGRATVVDLGGATLTNGDGLLSEGRTLYAVQNRLNQVAVLELSQDGRSASLRRTLTSAAFDVPTTVARSGHRLYLPNARFTTPPTPDTTYSVTAVEDR